MFLLVFIVVLVAGAGAALFSVPHASYVTVLQIGSAYGNNSLSGKLVEDTDGVVAKLERAVIPEVARTWRSETPARMPPELTVKAKKNAGLILLMSKAGVDSREDVSAYHEAVARKIVEAHRMLVMKQYESFMSQARTALVSSQAELQQVRQALLKQEQRRTLLGRQLERLNREIETVSTTRKAVGVLAEGEQRRGSLSVASLIDLPAMLDRRDALEETLNIVLDIEIAELKQQMANAASKRDMEEKKIEQLKAELDSQRLTRVESLALPMPDEMGLTPALMLVMSLILGLLLAWFAVMFAEYLARKRVQG